MTDCDQNKSGSDQNKSGSDQKNTSRKKTDSVTVEDVYKGMTLHQHILCASDTYIGTIIVDEVRMFIYDEDENKKEKSESQQKIEII